MVGFLCFLVLTGPPLGLLMLLKVPASWLRLRWGVVSSYLLAGWGPSDEFDEAGAASSMPDHPNVWTDGSLVLDEVTGISSSGAGFFADQSVSFWDARSWGQVDLIPVGNVQSCQRW